MIADEQKLHKNAYIYTAIKTAIRPIPDRKSRMSELLKCQRCPSCGHPLPLASDEFWLKITKCSNCGQLIPRSFYEGKNPVKLNHYGNPKILEGFSFLSFEILESIVGFTIILAIFWALWKAVCK